MTLFTWLSARLQNLPFEWPGDPVGLVEGGCRIYLLTGLITLLTAVKGEIAEFNF